MSNTIVGVLHNGKPMAENGATVAENGGSVHNSRSHSPSRHYVGESIVQATEAKFLRARYRMRGQAAALATWVFGKEVAEGHNKGDIHKAWDWYYRHTMPRYRERAKNDYQRLKPGEEGGLHYNFWRTPREQLGDWGIGVGLLFQTIGVMGILLAFLAFLNAWTIHYFRSDAYSDGQPSISGSIRGSAVCTRSQSVCSSATCTADTLLERKACEVSIRQGLLDFIGTLAISAVLYAVSKFQEKTIEKLDEGEQTAQDYSVMVEDPDPTDLDPEEWRKFFSRFGHVTYVTVALNNGPLLEAMARRRQILVNIGVEAMDADEEAKFSDNVTRIDRPYSVPWWKRQFMRLGLLADIYHWHDQLIANQKKLDILKVQQYQACKVFVVFEHEESQRKCLTTLTTGLIPASLEQSSKIGDDLKFKGTNVLWVKEAPEPQEVRWHNLHYSLKQRALEQLVTFAIASVIVAASSCAVWVVSLFSAGLAAILISLFNTVLPFLMQVLVRFEHHLTHSHAEASLMLKTVVAHWANTAFIIYLIAKSTDYLTEEFIAKIAAILWADAFTTPLVRAIDLVGFANRWILAPLAKTQKKMESYFRGTEWYLAERYSSMVKTFFVCLFFAGIFPAGYFIACLAMFVSYWGNKYCVLRVWRVPANLDAYLTGLARGYTALALLIHLMVTLHFYAGWPFDNVCALTGSGTVTSVDASAALYAAVGDPLYRSCSQAPTSYWIVHTKEWMTDNQRKLVHVYSVAAVVLTVLFGLWYCGATLAHSIYRLFYGEYRAVGQDQHKPFSKEAGICAYIPQIVYGDLSYPLLAINLSEINADHVDWIGEHSAHNLCSPEELPELSDKARHRLFSPTVHYPPDGASFADISNRHMMPMLEMVDEEEGKFAMYNAAAVHREPTPGQHQRLAVPGTSPTAII